HTLTSDLSLSRGMSPCHDSFHGGSVTAKILSWWLHYSQIPFLVAPSQPIFHSFPGGSIIAKFLSWWLHYCQTPFLVAPLQPNFFPGGSVTANSPTFHFLLVAPSQPFSSLILHH